MGRRREVSAAAFPRPMPGRAAAGPLLGTLAFVARWPGILLIAGLVLVVGSAVTALVLVPDSLRTPGAAVPFVLAALVACYAVVGVVVLRRPAAADAVGVPARLPRPIQQAIGATFALAATVCTLLAGPIGAVRYRSLAATWRTGLYAGLISGVFVFVFAVPMTLATLDILGPPSELT